MKRREFMAGGAAVALASAMRGMSAGTRQTSIPDQPGLNVISYNILAARGYPETNENRERLVEARKKMVERLALELELYRPAIISFQESISRERAFEMAERLGFQCAWFPPGWEGDERYPGGFPGTILSRFEIVDAENSPVESGARPVDLFTRHWGRARILTGREEIVFYSVHLHPSDPAVRSREVSEVLKVMQPDLEARRSLLFQGDLNHTPKGVEYGRWVAAGLVDAFAEKGEGTAWSVPSTEPRGRIDYIWAHGPLARRLRRCRILFEGSYRTNPDDPRSFALSDHLPVLAEFDP